MPKQAAEYETIAHSFSCNGKTLEDAFMRRRAQEAFRLLSSPIVTDSSLKVGQIRERDIKLPGRSFEYNVSKDINAAIGVSRSKLLSPESPTQPPHLPNRH
jgi:hypothetical protein